MSHFVSCNSGAPYLLNSAARLCTLALSFSLSVGISLSSAWSVPPELAPPPESLFASLGSPSAQAQMDDPEFVREIAGEETLVDLQNIEYDREALSGGRAVALSAIPGAGWSLLYANSKAQGVLLILGSLVSYGVGVAYLAGAFDESPTVTCNLNAYDFNAQQKLSVPVNGLYCTPKSPIHSSNANATIPETDPHLFRNRNVADPNQSVIHNNVAPPSGYMPALYSEVREYYQKQQRGQTYKGADRGLAIIAVTYAVSTVIGAVWSWVEISDQNDELRKRIESTAQGPNAPTPQPRRVVFRPSFNYDGDQTTFGLGAQF